MDCFKALVAAAAIVVALLYAGDVRAGDDIFQANYVRANLVKGRTTADDVLARFGQPTSQTMNDSSETWVYRRDAAAAQPQNRRGGGLRGLMGLAKGVAETAYAIAPEKTGGAANRLYSGASRVERTADAASALGAGAAEAPVAGNGPSVLEVRFQDGVVSGFSLR